MKRFIKKLLWYSPELSFALGFFALFLAESADKSRLMYGSECENVWTFTIVGLIFWGLSALLGRVREAIREEITGNAHKR